MISLKRAARVMDNAVAYRLWQAAFLRDKFRPIVRHNDLSRVRRVLDIGCGPGTNCSFFQRASYLGIDINPGYIDYARRRFARRFEVADATVYRPPTGEEFDFVLMNSLLHHIDDDGLQHILANLGKMMTDDGHVHILDLVLPEEKGLPRYLALNDRGDFGRPLSVWRELFEAHFQSIIFEPFVVKLVGVALWQLVYFKGRPKR
jgi:SAM-dependent methyltransferase